jgi:hypothetical protein
VSQLGLNKWFGKNIDMEGFRSRERQRRELVVMVGRICPRKRTLFVVGGRGKFPGWLGTLVRKGEKGEGG